MGFYTLTGAASNLLNGASGAAVYAARVARGIFGHWVCGSHDVPVQTGDSLLFRTRGSKSCGGRAGGIEHRHGYRLAAGRAERVSCRQVIFHLLPKTWAFPKPSSTGTRGM